MIRVLVVDGNELTRVGLKEILEAAPETTCLAILENGFQAVKYCQSHEVDVVLMDTLMKGMDGIEATKSILRSPSKPAIMSLTQDMGSDHLRTLIRAGVRGFLLKKARKEAILQAVEKVAQGGIYFCDQLLEEVVKIIMGRSFFEPSDDIAVKITRQEKKVMKYVARDFTNKEIAKELFISPRTVETHKRNLIRKLGLSNPRELHALALGFMTRP